MTEPDVKGTAEVVKGIVEAVPVYQDLLQPAVRQIGQALETVAKSVHLALAPISAMVWGYDQIAEFVKYRVAQHLADVPEDRIATPPLNVAGPTLESLRFTAAIPELREMYARLLATSMNRETRESAHPAFVEIIRQLTPDEARILQFIGTDAGFGAIKVIGQSGEGLQLIHNYHSLVGRDADCSDPLDCETSIDNLVRLRLLEAAEGGFEGTDYDAVEKHVLGTRRMLRFRDKHADAPTRVTKRAMLVTAFGRQFLRACVEGADRPIDSRSA